MDAFLGSDGNSELLLDTYGGSHLIGNCFFELAGRGLTGPANATPASGTGNGVWVSANNRDVRINNCISDGHSESGYKLEASQNNTLTGSRSSNNLTYGLTLANGATGVMTGNQFVGNSTAAFNIVTFSTSVNGAGNTPVINPSISASLGADVALNNTGVYFDGPSITMGQGTFLVTASITITDSAGVAGIFAKLWDGTSIIDSGTSTVPAAGRTTMITLCGVYNSLAGAVVKISARDVSSTSGTLLFNNTGNSKDCTITAVRIG
jgi:hypothetical protein